MSFNEGGMSPADIAAVTGNRNDGMFGGDNGWWIVLLFLFGWGRGGFGGGYGGGGGSEVRAATDLAMITGKLDGITNGICDSTYAITNAVTSGFYNAEISRCNQQAALMMQLNNMAADNAKCCCETQRLIERGFCDTIHQSERNTRDIIDNANGNTRAILDFLVQDKITTLQNENQSLRLAASQSNQNAVLMAAMDANKAEILRRTGAECPTAAYLVQPPTPVNFPVNGCGQVQFGNGGGCGCGGFGGYAA